MKEKSSKYELVVGLEVHVQLATNSKLFASDKNSFGDAPNTNVSPITLAHPGTLPKPNEKAIEYAIKMGLACNCEIARVTSFDRKNYFYPDLPKGYQTTQDNQPICVGGYLDVKSGEDVKRIKFNRIHIEEDAGKSMHDSAHEGSLLDFNRAGTPLIEMVTEPEISTSEEAGNLLTEIRRIVRYLGVGDGNMEEGSLRCDANISLRKKGTETLGQKVEIKNMNSIRNVQRAIQHEVQRQSHLLDQGKKIKQETRGFDDATGKTTSQRTKEEANDYRYFPCPDLLPITVPESYLAEIKALMPKLPAQLAKELQTNYDLTEYDAEIISENQERANYFFHTAKICKHYKRIANWMIGPIKNYQSEHNLSSSDFPITAEKLHQLIELVESGKLNYSTASTRVFLSMIENPSKSAHEVAKELSLFQDNDESGLQKIVDEVLAEMPDKVKAFKNGKKGLLGLFMGEVMKRSKGKANPQITTKLINESLNK
ncbi:Asp-tRNA(Asn)/Glu-tRNA(Gln) amidotransferase subunit GatB [Reichenbachiella agarivorans]|uniref:Aspartyl/glutamyl-tRNA(Asn/Gln) amidotransferase subunit B n=1 Tax=Reichenbachiella agarivorans TaxID=2979464 RepID=A0ABY6CMZ5_9BACT|nr:Asp-tRNA(Asn)/Glu-tRNA(Gln) amidotransferase subunit GatB [Reichenbachiella agarivorans]UXP31876.1 Asp-tRNA(Asn)/Glu-tRNA(Gln) amidotransferase subunit GatB [Reichenbachiella agarivorans]